MNRMLITLFGICLAGCSALAGKPEAPKDFLSKVTASAEQQTLENVVYDGTYFKISYPNGDIPAGKGVCTDVVIRAYRKQGFDLQKLVHEDMKAHFGLYPKIWGLKKTDTNIDHRRVPNLMVFFKRHGEQLPISKDPNDYQPGELVTWNVGRNKTLPHIGFVSEKKSADKKRPLIVHNIGEGPKLEDMLFDYPITGHFKFVPKP